MRILIVDTGSRFNRFGGQQRIAGILYKKLRRSFDTYYLGYYTDYIRNERDPNVISLSRDARGGLNPQLRRSRLSENALVRILYNVVYGRMLVGVDLKEVFYEVLRIKPDIIISNAVSDFALISYLRKRGLRFKSVYIDHGSLSTTATSYFSKEGIPLTVGSGIAAASVDAAKSKFFRFFDYNVALNSEQMSEIARFTDKVRYIPNGIKIDTKVSASEASRARRKYSIKGSDFVVLYIGRLFERQKNVGVLIKAFRKLKDQRARLLIIGEGPDRQRYETLAYGDKRIVFGDAVHESEARLIYGISDLFILPSMWEGASLTLLEAMQFELPIIMSENIHSRDLKVKGLGSLLSFRPDDESELAGLIRLIMDNKRERDRAVRVSKDLGKNFTEKRMLEEYTEGLKDL